MMRGRRLVHGVAVDWRKAKRLNRWRRWHDGPQGLLGLLDGWEQRRDGTWKKGAFRGDRAPIEPGSYRVVRHFRG